VPIEASLPQYAGSVRSKWQACGVGTYRVTGSAGGWRSVPWPFGILDVTPISLTLRSWHWSWWVRDLAIPLVEIQSIDVVQRFGFVRLKTGVALLTVRTDDGRKMTVSSISPDPLVGELRDLAYPVL
jgi:hypothetical protein